MKGATSAPNFIETPNGLLMAQQLVKCDLELYQTLYYMLNYKR